MIKFDYVSKAGDAFEDAMAVFAEKTSGNYESYLIIRVEDYYLIFREDETIPEITEFNDWSWPQFLIEYGLKVIRIIYNISDIDIKITI